MALFKRLGLLLVFYLAVNHSTSSPSSIHTISVGKDKYRRHDDQGIHSILLSIEDRSRNIDSIHYSVKRHETILERIISKVEAIDSRTVRMQALIDMKLDQLNKAVISTEFKQELLIEQMRKFESSQDLMNMKLSSIEAKLEDVSRKTQMNQEAFFEKIEDKHDRLYNKMYEMTSTAGSLKQFLSSLESHVNSTNNAVSKQLKEIAGKLDRNEDLEKLTDSLNGIHSHLNQSDSMWTQNDGPKASEKEMIDYIKFELNSESQKLGNKISNMYDDISHKVGQIEGMVKEGFTRENHTQKIISDDLKILLVEQRDSETFIDISMEKVLSIAHKRFNDIQRKLDHNFQNIASAQSLFLETCHRIQEDEPKLESRVSAVLEKIYDVFINGTAKNDKQLLEVLETLKAHNTQIMRIAKHTTEMIGNLAEDISQDHKSLDGSIMEVAERADTITSIVQDIHDEVYELNDTINAISYSKGRCADPGDDKNDKPDVVNALEAHYNEGVLKIVTDISPENHKLDTNPQDLGRLNKTIETKNLHTIVGTSKEESKQAKTEIDGLLFKLQNAHDSKKEDTAEITEEVGAQLMLSYIKLIKDKISLKEFLNEKLTGKSYQSITDMIQHLKPISTIPREFIRELDQYENRLKFDKIYLHEKTDTLIDEGTFSYDEFDLPN